MAPAATPSNRTLPLKESALFKDLLNHYETRQLKKGLKTAEQILKKFPEHGETLCMKGLILTHMGKREESLDLVKKGIRLDLTSHICWHVFGLIQKGEKNYEEALKSYTQALRFDKENLNLLQDTANLQTQLRHYPSLQETRHTILKLRPNIRRNWAALAIAYHLNGNLSEAKKILEHYELILRNVPDYDVEHSELKMYHIRILEELSQYREALMVLDDGAKSRTIVDRVAIMETRARLLTKLTDLEQARDAWYALIEKNAENHGYYHGYLSVNGIALVGIQDEQREEALRILNDLSEHFPGARSPRRLSLDVATGNQFSTLAKTFILGGLRAGVPSLFVDLKPLYSDSSKQVALGEIVSAIRAELEESPSQSEYDPSMYVWTLYYLAQHHSQLRQYKRALETLEVALAHTPTLPDLYTCKARVLKRSGDLLGGARCLEEARKLDGQDRFLNTKSAKYHLRAGIIEEANEILGLFTKRDANSPGADLEDMQSLLYLLEEGRAQREQGRLGLALKRYLAVQKVFHEIYNDQYDFHSYSVRRFTLDIYVNLLAWEDTTPVHPAHVKSAVEASKIYVLLHDDPGLASKTVSNSMLRGAEKKAHKKAKKAATKAQEDMRKAANNTNEDKGLELTPEKDDDPDGVKALTVADPIEQAWKLLKTIVPRAKDIVTLLAVYDVAARRNKFLQACQALIQAHTLDPNDGEVHFRLVDLRLRVSSLKQPLTDAVQSALSTAMAVLLPDDLALETFNTQFLQRHSTSGPSRIGVAKALHLLGAPIREVEDLLFGLFDPTIVLDTEAAKNALQLLQTLKSTRSDEFRSKCDERFELSTLFKTPDERLRLRSLIRDVLVDSTDDKSETTT